MNLEPLKNKGATFQDLIDLIIKVMLLEINKTKGITATVDKEQEEKIRKGVEEKLGKEKIFVTSEVQSATEFYLRYRGFHGALLLQKEQPNLFKKLKKWLNSNPADKDADKWIFNKAFEDAVKNKIKPTGL